MTPADQERLEVLGTCFTTGFVILALELTALRLLAPYFGASSYVTGIVINTILLALAVGYLLGGYVADRSRSYRTPYAIILAAACYLVVVHMTYAPMLHALARLSLIPGATAAMVLMFALPTALLGFISPYFIKFMSRGERIGSTSGQIYALSTLGGIVGGLTTTFLLLPLVGSRATFLGTITLLFANGLIGLVRPRIWALALPAFIPLLVLPTSEKENHVYREESFYNLITITESEGRYFLKLNDGFGHQSLTLDPITKMSGDYYDDFLVAQMLCDAERTLILGNGAGTSMMQTAHFFPTAIDGVEIDSKLTALGREYFGLHTSPRLRIYHEDARIFLTRNRILYDIIYVDLYAGGPYIPFHVATREFYELARRSLSPKGILALNIPFYAIGTRLEKRMLETMAAVFPVTLISRGMVYGLKSDISTETLEARLTGRPRPPALALLGDQALRQLQWMDPGSSGVIFTDDLAPIEQLTFEILARRADQGKRILD